MSLFNLDIRTVITLIFTGNLVVLAILISFRSSKTPGKPYMHFMYGKMLQAIAWPLLGLRGSIPDIYSVYIGNTILLIGFAFETYSLTETTVNDRKWRNVYAAFALTGIAAFWAVAHTPSMWVAIASLTTSILYLTASCTLVLMSRGSRLRISLGIMYGLFSIALAFRSWYGFFSHTEFALMSKNIIQTSSFMGLFFLLLVGGTGFLLMLKEQDDILLSESEEKYRTLVEKADEAIIIIQDEMLVFANTRMYNLMGIHPETLQNMSVFNFVHFDDREMVIANYWKRITGEKFYSSYDFRMIRQDGGYIWVSVSSSKIQWKGKPAVLSLLTDISYRKKLEEDRERIISDLQKALADVKTLSGLLPICSSCKKIRDDSGYWSQIEEYIGKHSEAEFSHSLCPDCVKKLYPDIYEKIQAGDEVK